ncbi:hypothetical protein KIPE111705_23750 [Kibdelosporangium persicum]
MTRQGQADQRFCAGAGAERCCRQGTMQKDGGLTGGLAGRLVIEGTFPWIRWAGCLMAAVEFGKARPAVDPAVVVRSVTVIMGTVVGLTFLFGFGNVFNLALWLGVPAWAAPLVAPPVDLLDHPGLVGGSDTWKGEELWHHRGSTRLSCGNVGFGWSLSFVSRQVSGPGRSAGSRISSGCIGRRCGRGCGRPRLMVGNGRGCRRVMLRGLLSWSGRIVNCGGRTRF